MKIACNSELAFGSLISGSLVTLGIAYGQGLHYLEQMQTCHDLFKKYGAVPLWCTEVRENCHYFHKISFISSIMVLASFCALAYPYLCKKQPNNVQQIHQPPRNFKVTTRRVAIGS